ncbi:MAG: hypothetical protein COX57_10645 [Alphaproteobacteria bacterium CG_4_10_14_0_2_um_filter_63_37]|nr:MAG: hypothetical protein AUJ55_10600 [Proteobacteria bacterium CG1_02_64_396]PJA24040.1 MAG: hypothetical protein COX57_10645 [Alphaproteobacteria bacterium CG_4_10_14_0_2_um_filter_63_37]
MKRKASLGIVFVTVMLDLIGFGMVLPLMPLYASDPRFLATPVQIGWLMGIYSLMQFLFMPLWGRMSDRWGRRPVLLIGLAGSAISYAVYGWAESLMVLFVSRAVAGVMGANIATAQAIVADITPPEKRAAGMGMIGAAFGLGFVMGPALGGVLSQWGGIAAAPLTAAVLSAVNLIFALFFLAETRVHGLPTAKAWIHPLSLAPWKEAMRYPAVLALSGMIFLVIAAFAAFEVVLPLWGEAKFGWTMADAGWVFAYVGVLIVLVQGGMVRRVVPKWGEKKAARIGLALMTAGLSLLSLWHNQTALYLLLIPIAFGMGLVNPTFSALVSLNSDPDHQGTMLGLFQSLSALGRVVGPVLGGMMFAGLGERTFVMSGAVMAVVLMVFVQRQTIMRDHRQMAATSAGVGG